MATTPISRRRSLITAKEKHPIDLYITTSVNTEFFKNNMISGLYKSIARLVLVLPRVIKFELRYLISALNLRLGFKKVESK